MVTENPIRTTRFASITTPLPVRKNDKFSDSGEGLVYDLGNYTILRTARNLLETKENIKIESHSFYRIICDTFLLDPHENVIE